MIKDLGYPQKKKKVNNINYWIQNMNDSIFPATEQGSRTQQSLQLTLTSTQNKAQM